MKARARTRLGRPWLAVTLAATMVFTASLALWAADTAYGAKKPAPPPATPTASVAAVATKPDTVHVSIQTVPPRKAQVKWGRKALGVIPVPRALVVERPRDSGPMDLVIRAPGYLPVHTRAYTFTDSRISVKLTPPAEKSKLFGYKQEVTPPVPDAGAPVGPPTPTATAPAPKPIEPVLPPQP